jgi:4'-phosphopantetheinyl transferase EntD
VAVERALASIAPTFLSAAVLAVEDRSADLHPDEWALVTQAVPRRVAGFSSGRAAARLALSRAGCSLAHAPILAEAGAPISRAGWRLSISHTDDLAVAVACRDVDAAGLGVDVERIGRMEPGLARYIVGHADRFPDNYGATELTLAFSLRESLFKALPRERQGVLRRIDLDLIARGTPAMLDPPADDGLEHRLCVAGAHVLTLAWARPQ